MHLHGTRAFLVLWLGQLVSILSSQMSQFALTIWAFEKTGSATAPGLLQAFYIMPFLLMSPLAGVWVDRYRRKWMMALSDLGAVTASGLEPALRSGGALAKALGPRFGVGPGVGMAVAVAACAAAIVLVGLGAYGVRAVREAERRG